MNHSDKTVSEQLLSLIRFALWQDEPDASCFGERTEWDRIAGLAYRQSVLGIMADGIKGLPEGLQPPKGMQMKIYGYTVKNNQYHNLLNSVIEELFGRLESKGIHCVLLKGQGLAMNYPAPKSRACGDIDLYVGRKNYRKACNLIKEWGMLDGKSEESYQHLHFSYRGVDVEIHRITGVIYNPVHNSRFRKWSENLLDRPTGRQVYFGSQAVDLPPVRFDALFIFYHLFRHLITGGVGLRQLMDCALFLHKFGDRIDRNNLLLDLKSMGLLRNWKVYGSIAVRYLGLPENEFPFYDNSEEISSAADFIFDEVIMSYGNFGFYDPNRKNRPDGFLSGKLHSFKMRMAFLNRYRKALGSQVLYFIPFYLWSGISNVIRHKDNFKK